MLFRSWMRSVAVSRDGTHIAPGSHDNTVCIGTAETRAVVYALEGHSAGIMSVVVTPDGKRVALGSHDKNFRVWEETGKTVLDS